MDDVGPYTDQERRAFDPGPCGLCGSTNVSVEWHNAETMVESPGRWIPGLRSCRDCRGLGPDGPPDPFAD